MTGRALAYQMSGEASPNGMDQREALAAAIEQHRGGRLDDAEHAYRRVLGARPEDPDALHYLGVLCHQRGRSDEALTLIRRAIAVAPDYADAHANLGNVLKEQGRADEAARAYRRALELRPDDPAALTNLGVALRSLGELDEAVRLHRRAVELAPRHVAARFNLGNALRAQGDLAGAIEEFRATIALDPANTGAYQALGRALYRAGRSDEAVDVFAAWLRHEPGNPVARHMLAATSGRDVPARASDGYVRELFDRLADGYDEHLRGLGYCVPELVAAALAGAIGTPRRDLDVLDAGCGTGLCGAVLRPYARRLVGVDLSDAMLAKARARSLYDLLAVGELTAYLAARSRDLDLILIADTLVYFGDLGAVFDAAASALRPGGRLIFSVESAEAEAPAAGYRIGNHGRYGHAEAYLRDRLAAAGLEVVLVDRDTLRQEVGRAVEGLVVVARSPGGPGALCPQKT